LAWQQLAVSEWQHDANGASTRGLVPCYMYYVVWANLQMTTRAFNLFSFFLVSV
ncbi:hypothetical protein ACJX0J_032299, partial [Zea mays]